MQPSDRSKGPPKMTIGPLPAPPAGSRPPPQPATPSSRGAPAVGTGILSGSGLNFGPAYVPPRRQPAQQGQPVLVTVPRPAPPRPPAHTPLPMNGVLEAYAKGAKKPVVWPDAPGTRPATPQASAPEPVATPEPVEDPGPAPAWMTAAAAQARGANRLPLYVGAAALLAAGAFGAFTLLTRHPSEPAPAPAPAVVESPAAAAAAPAAEPLRPQMEVATAEAPPAAAPEPKPAAKPRKVQTAAAEHTYAPIAHAAPPPVQATPQPLAIAPPPAPVQQPPPRIIIPHVDPNSPIVTRSSVDQ